jgi:hypothetical protein
MTLRLFTGDSAMGCCARLSGKTDTDCTRGTKARNVSSSHIVVCITRVIKECGGRCAMDAEVWVHQQESGAVPATAYMLLSVDSVQQDTSHATQPDADAVTTVTLRP